LSSCEQGGWLLGNIIDGVQAEYARIPLAGSSLHHLPTWIDEEAALMLADIIPTGLEVGVHSRSVELHNELLWTRNITIRNLVARNNPLNAIQILGLPKAPVRNILFENVYIEAGEDPGVISNAENILFRNVRIITPAGGRMVERDHTANILWID
jgi:threonine dehydrogenase-like Zn-dependent dehydrogenase